MDNVSKSKRSEIMSKIHEPTLLEDSVHGYLCGIHAKHEMYPKIKGRPDVKLLAGGRPIFLFVDGCFWHCCPEHYRRPKTNAPFWRRHIEDSNMKREARRAKLPYRWVKIWEHQVGDGSFKRILKRLLKQPPRTPPRKPKPPKQI